MEVVPFSRHKHKFDRLLGKVGDKPVFIQAPKKYQVLVDQFLDSVLPWEKFLKELSRRTGAEKPEEEFFWPRIVLECGEKDVKVKLVEPDLDKVMKKVSKRMSLKGEKGEHVIQEARLWFLSGSGYMRHFYAAFDAMFFWLPFHFFFLDKWLKFWSLVVNIIPGDQKDVMAAVNFAYDEMVDQLVKFFSKHKKSLAFIDQNIASRVERMVAEL